MLTRSCPLTADCEPSLRTQRPPRRAEIGRVSISSRSSYRATKSRWKDWWSIAGSMSSQCSISPTRSAVLRFGDNGVSLEEIILRHALGMPIPSLQRQRLAAGVMMIPIPGAGILQEVSGIDAAKAVPLIEDIQITAHPGERLVPFPEGSRYPGFIFARGETPDVVEAALRESFQRLTFVLE